MAMTKEQQKAAVERILAKEPMTEEEKRVAEMLKKRPEDYMPPDPVSWGRECGMCGKRFKNKMEEGKEITALDQFSEHMREHNPSPAQWTEAHQKIQAGNRSENKE